MIFPGTGFLVFLGICAVSLAADIQDCRSYSYVLELIVFDERIGDNAPDCETEARLLTAIS
jgi:hypothetical protein